MIDARIFMEIGLKRRFGSKLGTLAKGSCSSVSLPKLERTCVRAHFPWARAYSGV
jgi:hypothetical protein